MLRRLEANGAVTLNRYAGASSGAITPFMTSIMASDESAMDVHL